jgi:hypothetical protein
MGRNNMLKGLDAFGKVCLSPLQLPIACPGLIMRIHLPVALLVLDDGGREGEDWLRRHL